MSFIKHDASSTASRLLLFLLVLAAAAACRPQAAAVLPTAIITLTPLPRSTPLPALPTARPLGQPDNPLRLIVRPVAELSDSTIDDLETAIQSKTKFTVKIQVVNTDAEALAALCSASPAQPALAWLSGMAYVAANAMNCGQPELVVSRGTGSSAATGQAAAVIARRGIDTLSAVDGRTFCRISSADLVSWLVPSLMMRAAGLSPIDDPKVINDYDTPEALVKAVANSACDAAAIDAAAVAEWVTDDPAVAARVAEISTSVEIPFSVLTVSSDMPLPVLTSLLDELIRVSKDRILKPKLQELLGQDALVRISSEDLQPLLDFARSTGQDFAQLGA